MPECGWKTLTARSEAPVSIDGVKGPLQGALLTCYEPADFDFLAETMLPDMLSMDRGMQDDDQRGPFVVELVAQLERIKKRIVVISTFGDVRPGNYSWLSRYLIPTAVNLKGHWKQHSKLWMFHWKKSASRPQETLEIVISSCNLNTDAVSRQIQAAWRYEVPLTEVYSPAQENRWGVLPAYIDALADHSSDTSQAKISAFRKLLGRAACPEDVTFVASVPGAHDKSASWGLAGLQAALGPGGAYTCTVLSPYTGKWDAAGLKYWADACGTSASRSRLVVLPAGQRQFDPWVLPQEAIVSLSTAGAAWQALAFPKSLHELQEERDSRWVHAKLYEFKAKNGRTKLLLTSANFSPSAWGYWHKGRLVIRNFELGVLLHAASLPFGFEAGLDWAQVEPYGEQTDMSSGNLLWAEATWDGQCLTVAMCASQPPALSLVAGRAARFYKLDTANPVSQQQYHLTVEWTIAQGLPQYIEAYVDTGTIPVRIPVLDNREIGPGDDDLLYDAGMTAEQEQTLRDELLFKQYGAKKVKGQQRVGHNRKQGRAVATDEYNLPAVQLCREWLDIVDNWRMQKEGAGGEERAYFEQQGHALLAAFLRLAADKEGASGLAASLVHDELNLLLSLDKGE